MSGSSEDSRRFFQDLCFEKALENKPSIFLLLPNQI